MTTETHPDTRRPYDPADHVPEYTGDPAAHLYALADYFRWNPNLARGYATVADEIAAFHHAG